MREYCIRKTDTLWTMLKNTRSEFKYDMNEIANRREIMGANLQVLKFAKKGQLSPPEESAISQYNGVYRVYKATAGAYKTNVLNTEELFYRIKVLDRAVKKGEFDTRTAEFNQTWQEIKDKLSLEYQNAVDLGDKLKTVEPAFARLQPQVESLTEKFSSQAP